MLPESTVLGELKIIEVYEFYIQPALFACLNRAKQVYLAVWIDDSEKASRWLYVALSRSRFSSLRRGEVSLRRAFAEPEDGVALDVVVPRDPEQMSQVNAIPAGQVEDAWLPVPGEYLEIEAPMPHELQPAGLYSRDFSTQSFRIEANVYTFRTPEARQYTGAANPLDHETYEDLRHRLKQPRSRDVKVWHSEYDDRSPEPALVA